MPRAKVEREISNDGQNITMETDVTERDVTKSARYTIPANAQAFKNMVNALSEKPDDGQFAKSVFGPDRNAQDESPLDFVYRLYKSSVEKTARAMVYESVAQESTYITVGKERRDIMEFPLLKLVKAINGMRAQRDIRLATIADGDADAEKTVDRSIGFGPWRTAARKLVEDGKANENAASGMLEAVGA